MGTPNNNAMEPATSSEKVGLKHEEDNDQNMTYLDLLRTNRPFRLYMTSYLITEMGV